VVVLSESTPATDEGWHVSLADRSVTVGTPLVIEADRPLTGVSIRVARAGEHEDEWTLSAGLEVDAEHPTIGRCLPVGDQPPGLYWLTALEVSAPQPVHVLTIPRLLFEVRAPEDRPRSLDQLEAEYEQVVRRRQERREAGIGSGRVAAGVLVFVKDLLTTTPLNLVTCEVMPLDPVGWTAEVQAVDRLLIARGASPLPWTEQALDQIRRAEPATLIQFPVVRANTLDECGELALGEAALLVMLLAAHRGSLGDIFCTIVHDPQSGQLVSSLHPPPYMGNLMGGFTSGEAPESVRRNLHALKGDPTLQLFVALLGEASRERRSDFQYVRLWSLLETMAKSRGCAGRHKRDWNGKVQLNKKGHPIVVQEAADQVYELLREMLAPHGISEQTFVSGLAFGTLSEQIPIWYRRRNCTAHGDPDCVCRDSSKLAGATSKYANCRRARRDDQLGRDGYLATLRAVAERVVFALLRERWPAP